MLPPKSSRNEQHDFFVFVVVGKKINANQIHSEMHPVYDNKCFTNQSVHVWCKRMLGWQIFVSYTKVQLVILQWQGQQPATFFCIRHSEVC